jgi:N-glycosylase/DNA lyase
MIRNIMHLPIEFLEHYKLYKSRINQRLKEFKQVPESDYFYELCFCICTPQSKAESALQVQQKLMQADFYNKPFIATDILADRAHYIRFHNQKAIRLYNLVEQFPDILKIVNSGISNFDKRNVLKKEINGFGLKESSHFLRNIGYSNLAILDRHILKHLLNCGVIDEIPKNINNKLYFEIEHKMSLFADAVGIPMDCIDLLFWSFSAQAIIK